MQTTSSGSAGTRGGMLFGGPVGNGGGPGLPLMLREFDDIGGGGEGGPIIPPTTTPETPESGGSDASSFIPLKERIRVVSWFES